MKVSIYLAAASFCLMPSLLLSGCITATAKDANSASETNRSDAEDRTPDKKLVGRYYLAGVMETGSGLRLNSDGSFNWFLSVGSLDIFSGGSWSSDANTVTLIFDPPKEGANHPPMGKRVMQTSGQNLVPDKQMGGIYIRSQPKKSEE